MFVLYPFRNGMMSVRYIAVTTGIKESTLRSIKHKQPDRTFDDIVDNYKPKQFTWASIAKSIGIKPSKFAQRASRYGLQETLLMSPENRITSYPGKSNVRKIGVMDISEIPAMDPHKHLAVLIESLERLGYAGDELKREALKRVGAY
jgi:hypothetical protein